MARQRARVTIVDIAQRANVSFKTVSRVLNDNPSVALELRKRVLEAAAELRYQPNLAARALAGPRTLAIAMLTSIEGRLHAADERPYRGAYFAHIEYSALRACQEVGYRFVVEVIDHDSLIVRSKLRDWISRLALDGVIVPAALCDFEPLLDELEQQGLPYVRVSPGTDLDRGFSVALDNYGGACALIDELVSLGHRRIAMIGGLPDHLAAATRVTAYRDWCAAAGCPPSIEYGDFRFEDGMDAAAKLLASPDRPTAIFAANDEMGAGTIAAAIEAGLRVPADLSVGGFDDTMVARMIWPPLTTVRQPLPSMIRAAIRYLVDVAAGAPERSGRTEFPFVLVPRRSTGPAPG